MQKRVASVRKKREGSRFRSEANRNAENQRGGRRGVRVDATDRWIGSTFFTFFRFILVHFIRFLYARKLHDVWSDVFPD